MAKKKIAKKKPTVAKRIADLNKELEAAQRKKGLERFSWNEYTPHWNDGDACEFSVNIDSLAINEEVGEDEVESLYYLEHAHKLLRNKKREEARVVLELSSPKGKQMWEIERLRSDLEIIKSGNPKEVEEKYRIKKTITDLLGGIDDSVYQDMFGEGLVVVSRDGVTVEEYEHD